MQTILFLLIAIGMVGCGSDDSGNDNQTPDPNPIENPQKSKLLSNLQQIQNSSKILIGHQGTNIAGVGWRLNNFPNGDKSDFKDVSGKKPAVFGWEIAPNNESFTTTFDGITFDETMRLAIKAYENNAVNTFSMHPYRLDNNQSSWNTTPGYVTKILPNGAMHNQYKAWLDKLIIHFKKLKNSKGEAIPFIFRPYHEMDGGWFWWGTIACTDAEYIDLFRFTIDYMRNNGLNNMLVCYSPGYETTEAGYLKRYPGDKYVDILGIDAYHLSADPNSNNGANWNYNLQKLNVLKQVGISKNKPIAWAETGQQNLTSNNYFTELTQFITTNNIQLSYMMFWANYTASVSNGGGEGFYVPYQSLNNTTLKNDFINFTNQPNYIFQNSQEAIYK
ncbi:MAG: glycosyl hydrolase [Myroides sp.]